MPEHAYTHIIAAILLAAAPSLTACSTSNDDGAGPPADKSRIDTVDPAEDMAFGKTYTWPGGLTVTVTEARLFTDFTADEGPADPKNHEFRAKLRLTDGGKEAADLSDISTIVMSATENAITAAPSAFQNGATPLAGRLAPGATATKTYDALPVRTDGSTSPAAHSGVLRATCVRWREQQRSPEVDRRRAGRAGRPHVRRGPRHGAGKVGGDVCSPAKVHSRPGWSSTCPAPQPPHRPKPRRVSSAIVRSADRAAAPHSPVRPVCEADGTASR
ncbi:hypothetical protein [Streptomyces sp. NBC_01718]|uniref:hypothetical protein n=1 Tax=Streptomyces sp. NBC_01718 TaxID=2975919 RepID=UPI00352CF2F0